MTVSCKFHRGRTVCRAALSACLAGVLALSSGCGTSTYEQEFTTRLADLHRTSAFGPLDRETVDLPVNFRVPDAFTHVFTLQSADPAEPKHQVYRDHVLPPGMMDGVGHRRTFEGKYVDNVQVQTPYYLYVWMYDAPLPKDGLQVLRNHLRLALGDPKLAWENVDVKDLAGKTLAWKRLEHKGNETFEVARSGTLHDETSPGIFQLWFYDTPGWTVLLGWRASDDAWEKSKIGDVKLKDIPALVAGTLEVPDKGSRNTKPVPTSGEGMFALGGGPISKSGAAPDQGHPGAAGPGETIPGGAGQPGNGLTLGGAAQPGSLSPASGRPDAAGVRIPIASTQGWNGRKFTIKMPNNFIGSHSMGQLLMPGSPPGSRPEIIGLGLWPCTGASASQLMQNARVQFTHGLAGARDTEPVEQEKFRVADMVAASATSIREWKVGKSGR